MARRDQEVVGSALDVRIEGWHGLRVMDDLHEPKPILVVDLFPRERASLLDLLRSLEQDDWTAQTAAGAWTVKDVAAHLVADDLGRVSGQRDGHGERWNPSIEPLNAFVDRRNAEWVAAMRRISPAILIDLLEYGFRQTQDLFESLDPFAIGAAVTWAGPDPAPNWLDMARELTERWHHHQQIREAVGRPVLDAPELTRAVLATFAFALPPALDGMDAQPGTAAHLHVSGPTGGNWAVVRSDASVWRLLLGTPAAAAASIELDPDTAWRAYMRMLPAADVRRRAQVRGDERLAHALLGAFALVS